MFKPPFPAPHFYKYRGNTPTAEVAFWLDVDACIALGTPQFTDWGVD